ncbi:YadA family autotransporter adhesin [Arsenophonus apicola]|uniref:YadA family autotransporter adhesin n=1 Tax=Arsenophonus apicola TaxID=2879119 RepID=UPI003879A144
MYIYQRLIIKLIYLTFVFISFPSLASYSVARGNSSGANSIAIAVNNGNGTIASGNGAIAIGFNATANDNNSISLGVNANSGLNSIAIGVLANASETNSIAIGNSASSTLANSIALGNNSSATAVSDTSANTAANAIIAGNTLTINQAPSFGVMAVGNRQIQGVADGALTSTSTDAVNGSQLYTISTALNANTISLGSATASAFGGGSAYDNSTGSWTAPSYTVQGNSYNNVGDAIGGIDNNLSNLNANIGSGTTGVVQRTSATNSLVLTALNGTAAAPGNAQKLSNVAAGDLNTNSTDAVNGSQLKTVVDQVDKNRIDIADLTTVVNSTSGSSLIKQDSTTNLITIGSDKMGKAILVSGIEGNRIISGVMAGVNTDDVATVGQLQNIVGNISNRDNTGLGVAIATGRDSLAVGSGSKASGINTVAIGNGSSATAANSVALGHGAIAYRDNSLSVGSVGNERQITNVAAGKSRTDAVNVGQVNDAFQNLGKSIEKKVNHINKKLTSGVASAMAMSGIPQAYLPDSNLVGLSASTYNGQSAIAIGVSKTSENGKWMLKINGSGNTQSDFGAVVGVGYQW